MKRALFPSLFQAATGLILILFSISGRAQTEAIRLSPSARDTVPVVAPTASGLETGRQFGASGKRLPAVRQESIGSRGAFAPLDAVLWYNGDLDGVDAFSNEQDTSLGADQFCSVYDDFVVEETCGWDVTAVFSNDLLDTNVTGANWEIRQGIFDGNGGTLIASGTTMAPNVTPTGRSALGYNEFQVEVPGLSVHLPPGTYWLNVTAIGDLTGRSFDSSTSGASAVGMPPGNDQNAFANSNFFGFDWINTANQGQPYDFSMGVVGTTPAPEINSPPTATATVGQPFSYQVTATNNPTGFAATSLPANLTIDDATGLIKGKPLADGSFLITLSASNDCGTGMALLTLTVNPSPPVVTSSATATATVGQPISYQITATNNPTSFAAAGLPANVTVDTSTGLISGTSTIVGSFPITLSATNAGGTGMAPLTLTVNPPPPVITSALNAMAVAGQLFSYQITATNSPDSYNATALPAGLGVDTGTGEITGTPATVGSFMVNLSASNAGGIGTAILALNVGPAGPKPVITSPLVATTTASVGFSYQIEVTGGTSLTVGGLPGGLTFDPVLHAIFGQPSEAGTFQIELSATNSFGTTTANLALTVQPTPAAGPVIISVTSATGRTGSPFKFQVITSGGSAATRLSTAGLPNGLSADPMTGEISGTATTDGSVSVSLTATEGTLSNDATLELTFTSDRSVPVIVSANSALLFPGLPFSYTILAPTSDTTDPVTYSEIGPLPPGLGLDSATGIISGTPLIVRDLQPMPSLSGGVISNVQAFACNTHGCATQSILFSNGPGAVNISTRLSVGTGDNVLIGGFIIQDAPMKVVVRGIGPSISLPGVLADPFLELHDTAATIAMNDNWKDDLAGGSQEAVVTATRLAPTNDLESAILGILEPGAYTAILHGANSGTGIGLVEVYYVETASIDVSSEAHLANISTRGNVQGGDNVMIGGFINQGEVPMQVLLRARGPTLGVSGALANPLLELHDSTGATIATNGDWKDDPTQAVAIMATGLAPTNDLESAILITLPVGESNYTAIVKGTNNTTGVGLVEAYFGNPDDGCLGTLCP